jgi:hypothetical protein
VTIQTSPHARGRFTVYSPDPVIQSVSITRSHTVDAAGKESYGECAQIAVTDCNGWEEVSVTTLDPAGETRPNAGDCGGSSNDGPYLLNQNWAGWEQPAPLVSGSYTIVAQDSGGRSDTIVTAPAPETPAVHGISYPANGSTITETVPTFTWDALPGADHFCFCLEEAGHSAPVPWSRGDIPGDATFITYNEDGSARDSELTAGSLYRLHIMAYFPDDDPDTRVSLVSYAERIIEFWVAPKPEPVSIEGKIKFDLDWSSAYFMSGDSSQITPAGIPAGSDLSRDGQRAVYSDGTTLHVCNIDGSNDTPLPGSSPGACGVRWSPDGKQIAFAMPTEDDPTPEGCGGAGEVFVINADGLTPARQITQHPGPDIPLGWSPDGRYLLWQWNPCGLSGECTLWVGRADGTEAPHPITGEGMPLEWISADNSAWSPDGSRILVHWDDQTSEDDRLATLGTIAPDGTDRQPILQYIVPEGCTAWWLSPYCADWSPDGKQIVFSSAMQALPDDSESTADSELYLVNADGSGLTRLTYDFGETCATSWVGPNTQAGADVSQTICDTTITFENVTQPGVTTATVYDSPPVPEPQGFQFIGQYYEIKTTAGISGPITIQIHYDDADVPGGQEQWLSLLHWEGDHWVDITVRPIDTVNNIITGECTSLSGFAMVVQVYTADWVPPLRNGTTVDSPAGPFKRGRTIPLKFQLLDQTTDQLVPDAEAQELRAGLQVFYEKPSASGTPIDPGDSPPDVGGEFRYDAAEHQFIYNLSTKDLAWAADYTYGLDLLISGLPAGQVFFSLR